MKDFLNQRIDALDRQGLRRSLKMVVTAQGREVTVNGRSVINFCSNDYLGLAGDERLRVAAEETMRARGFGAGAARLVCGNFDVHEALERELALVKHTPAALFFNAGYMANTGIIPALVGRGDAVFSDKLNHASIIDGIVLSRAKLHRYAHKDMNSLEGMLQKASPAGRKLIITDTVFSMDGDVAPLKDIAALAKKYGAWLMVDEAHAFGVLGPTGAGLVEAEGLGDEVHVQMGTLSKAAGAYGAYAAGSLELKEYLLNTARSFIFTTALPPAVAGAALCALRIMREESWRRERVLANAVLMREGLSALGFDTLKSVTPVIPVMIKDAALAAAMSARLLDQGMFVAAIRPPTVPAHTARLRVTVTAAHTVEDIARCVEAFKRVV
ncbi:MAG: 8-amino-7-oxononanoate synthase [Candidatus Omnitrophica bacterium]|nr:8-amino-7-oxononanoate synthase [Candidatus Omnitrophota bacterium]